MSLSVHIKVSWDEKMRPVETILWMEEEGIKENDRGDEFNLVIF
jgi:hypothetical protein